MLTCLVVLALLWPLFWVLRVLFVTKALVGLEFQRQQVVAVPIAEIPAHLREAAQPWIVQLDALGFRLLGGWRIEWAGEPSFNDDMVVLTRSGHPVRAVVRPHGESARSGECWVELRTTTAEGFEIITASHAPEQLVPLPPGIEVEVVAAALLPDLVQRHTARIAAVAAGAWVCTDLEGSATREQYICDARFAFLGASGLVAPRTGGSFSYRVWPAVQRAMAIIRQAARMKKALAGRRVTTKAELSAESRATFDLQHYRQLIALSRGRFSLRTKTVISVVSVILFAAALAWRMSPVVAAMSPTSTTSSTVSRKPHRAIRPTACARPPTTAMTPSAIYLWSRCPTTSPRFMLTIRSTGCRTSRLTGSAHCSRATPTRSTGAATAQA